MWFRIIEGIRYWPWDSSTTTTADLYAAARRAAERQVEIDRLFNSPKDAA